VVIAWVFFRAADLGAALHVLKGMAGANGVSLPASLAFDPRFAWFADSGVLFKGLLTNSAAPAMEAFAWIGVLCLAVWVLPNTQQLARDFDPAYESVGAPTMLAGLRWNLSSRWATLSAIMLALGVLSLNRVSAFLYFQF